MEGNVRVVQNTYIGTVEIMCPSVFIAHGEMACGGESILANGAPRQETVTFKN